MRYILFLSLLCSVVSVSFSQNNWKSEYTRPKVFIENKGQFDGYADSKIGKINYAVDLGKTKILFGQKGVAYSFMESDKIAKEKRGEVAQNLQVNSISDHKSKEQLVGKFLFKSDNVTMLWGNSNPCNIIPANKISNYFSYTFKDISGKYMNENKICGYEQITYENIYPNIDIQYTVHPESGVKYAIILHPGANPSDIQMVYDKSIKLENGKIKIPTFFGDIIDHEPFTFYDRGQIIKSAFLLSNSHTVQFQLENYDKNRRVIIDPWTQMPTFATNWDCVWECDKDASGNVYVLGGIMPMQILKYNSGGVLQWTYNTPYDTSNVWLGTFAVDNIGNSYVTAGSTAQIQKVNSTGALVWNNTTPVGAFSNAEFWTISFNCDQTKLVVGGTGGSALTLSATVYDINVNTGAVITSADFAQGSTFGFPPSIQEVRAICTSPNGKYYFMTQDTVGAFSQNFNLCSGSPLLYKVDNSYDLGYKCENYRYDNSGICAIKANNAFYYTQNGSNVHKRNLQTGAILTTATIPGGTSTTSLGDFSVSNSGLDIDNCGNVYVGSSTGVVKYDANLTQLATYPTSFKVYDVHVSIAGDIIAGGSTGNSSNATRTGYIQSFAASACAPLAANCCDATICPIQSVCQNDAAFNLTVATPGGTWSGPGISSTGQFNPSTAGVGSHTITYTLPCGSESIIIVVSPCQALTACIETNGSISISGGVAPYTWAYFQPATNTPITTQTQCQSCGYTWFFGQCLNGITPVTACSSPAQWVNFATGINATAPVGVTQVQVTDNAGTVTVFTISSLTACNNVPCPTITVSNLTQTNVSCFGGTDGSATVSATGGTTPYTYSWSPGNLVGVTQTNLAAGNYTVTATDNANCTGTISISVTQPPAIQLTLGIITPAACGSSSGAASVSVNGGTGPYSFVWSPNVGNSSSVTNISGGTYSVQVTDAIGCQQTIDVLVPTIGGPSISNIIVTDNECFGDQNGGITISANGGTSPYTYSLNNGNTQNSNVFANLNAGSYDVTVFDATNCPSSQTVTITEPQELLADAGQNQSGCATDVFSLEGLAVGGTLPYQYNWIGVQNNQNVQVSPVISNTYTLEVIDLNGCLSTDVVSIQIIPCGSLVVFIPNVFTPNGDLNNDTYGIISQNALSQEAVIVNRWGDVMVELNSPNQTWDGKTNNGNIAKEGVYFIKYRLTGLNNTEEIGHTFFHLHR
jgi:gliding motility-associated-like protein